MVKHSADYPFCTKHTILPAYFVGSNSVSFVIPIEGSQEKQIEFLRWSGSMKSVRCDSRKKYLITAMAIAEGVWNGLVVSTVITISAFLVDTFWIF